MHPCSGHMATCDHCFVCDVVGICCASVSAAERRRLEAVHQARTLGGLALLVQAEAAARDRPSLATLIQAEAPSSTDARPLGPILLPAAPLDPLPTDSGKEPTYVVARTVR